MTSVQENLKKTLLSLPEDVTLVAVSKYNPASAIEEAYALGQRVFGESHVQELQQKKDILPNDIEWHFIGHLQTNKVKYIAPYISLIHAVDSVKLLQEINKQAAKNERIIRCLLQIHVAQEDTKFGFTCDNCREFLNSGIVEELNYLEIAGLMCMASNTDDEGQVREEFHNAHVFFEELKTTYFENCEYFKECSWGMTHDYLLAVEEGGTMVRIGSKIFGDRMY